MDRSHGKKYLSISQIDIGDRVNIASYYLEGQATHWFESLLKKDLNPSWKLFRSSLLDRFNLENAFLKRKEFLEIHQDNDIDSYNKRFLALYRFLALCILPMSVCSIMIDSGSTENVISDTFVMNHNLKFHPLNESELADGNRLPIIGSLRGTLKMAKFEDDIDFKVASISNYDIILGKKWLTLRNPRINWQKKLPDYQAEYRNFQNLCSASEKAV